jgi:hypothetical protein
LIFPPTPQTPNPEQGRNNGLDFEGTVFFRGYAVSYIFLSDRVPYFLFPSTLAPASFTVAEEEGMKFSLPVNAPD